MKRRKDTLTFIVTLSCLLVLGFVSSGSSRNPKEDSTPAKVKETSSVDKSPASDESDDSAKPKAEKQKPTVSTGIVYEGGDGSSMENAVIIKGAPNSRAGIKAEHTWIGKSPLGPGWRFRKQSVMSSKGKMYDRFNYTHTNGETKSIYFDITDFYGKHDASIAPNLVAEMERRRKEVVEGNTAFALDLYEKLSKQAKEDNLFFSPYSISTALAMTYGGARGQTETQMAQVLHFMLKQKSLPRIYASLQKQLNAAGKKGGYQLLVANALWGQKGYDFLQEYLELTEKQYAARLNEVDFIRETEKTRQIINEWVEKKTNHKIKDLIEKGVLKPLTRLVLTNAIYFKGDWAEQFDAKYTKEALFYVTPDKTVEAPLMYKKDRFRYAELDDLQVLSLLYKGEDLSMVVLLSKDKFGIGKLEKKFNGSNLKEWLGKPAKREVQVYLSKFKMTSKFKLARVLSEMGMPEAFSQNADFSGMNGRKDLFLSDVVHKAFVEVNEEGTEATAATGGVVSPTSATTSAPVFRADHPFLFLIRDNQTGSILFLGRVINPIPKEMILQEPLKEHSFPIDSVCFSKLHEAVSFIASCLEKDEFKKLSAACTHEDKPPYSILKSLKSVHKKKSLPKLYEKKEFPEEGNRFKLGGHMSELGYIHIDFVKTDNVWQLDYIYMCR